MPEYRLHGPPGCGKTTQLARAWVPRAAERHGADAILVCSLTKTAAREIASRDVGVHPDRVGTLHAHAFRALGRPELTEGHLTDWNARHPQLALSGGNAALDDGSPAQGSTQGDRAYQLLDVYRHRRTPETHWREDVVEFRRLWEEWKRDEDYLDFTDLIEDALSDVPVAPGAPSVLIVDEAQDSSSLELDLVRSWASGSSTLVLAGDGDQAIYGWRGADARAFLEPEIPEDQNYRLTQSYRVPRAVYARATAWISRASYRFAVEYHPRDADGEYRRAAGSQAYVEPLVADVERSLADGSVMLIASCDYMLRKIIRVLRQRGVLFHNPYRVANGRWNPLRGGAQRLRAFLRPDRRLHPEDFRLWNVREMWRWVELIKSDRLPTGAKSDLKARVGETRSREDLPPLTADESRRILGDDVFDELRRLFSSDESPEAWLSGMLLESRRSLMSYAFRVVERGGIEKINERPRLVVGTIHSVKGGEADSVHLLPDLSTAGMRQWTRVGDDRDAVLRQFYVGMTRARERLVVHQPGSPYHVPI